ncbi:MAG: type IV toxin-antitoxin system AbiEi family antitoxin domain-containing protein [Bacteroidales bacterium]|nr:type IV toxin-antitoxin system AbiEi family antitoxin domain-containing protein [Bacteroidales bacterium]
MISSQNNILPLLYRSNQSVFRLKDIALLAGESNFQSLNKRVNYLVKKGELINLRKGIYAIHNYNEEELSAKIFSPSYLSIDYVLQKEGIIFQYSKAYTSLSYLSRVIEAGNATFVFRKIKSEILINSAGIYIQKNGIGIACPERALLDYLYLFGDTYFDNLNVISKQKIKKLLSIYNSKTLMDRTTKLFQNA